MMSISRSLRGNRPSTHMNNTLQLLVENQLVGLADGYAVYRNLYETVTGERVSVRTSKVFWSEDHLSFEEVAL